MTKLVLGKGLSALIPTEAAATHSRLDAVTAHDESSAAPYQLVAIERISANPHQPRQQFDEAALAKLAASIKQHGLMQPIVVRTSKDAFSIIAGERRFRAAQLAGMTEIPVVVMDQVDDARTLELALIENIHREDLNPIELAEAYRRLIESHQYTQQQLADKLGKSRTALTNSLRLLGLPQEIQLQVRSGQLSEGHARALLALDSEREMLVMAEKIRSGALSVRQVEQAAPKKRGKKLVLKRKPLEITEIETRLKRLLGTSVKIHHGLSKGTIQIEYYGTNDLDRIYDLLTKIDHVQ